MLLIITRGMLGKLEPTVRMALTRYLDDPFMRGRFYFCVTKLEDLSFTPRPWIYALFQHI